MTPRVSSDSKDEKKSVSAPEDRSDPRMAVATIRTHAVTNKLLKRIAKLNNMASLPPELSTTPTLSHTFRFRAHSALVGVGVTAESLLGICGGVCTVINSTIRHTASSLKISHVHAWLPGSLTGNDSIFIDWAAAGFGGRGPDKGRLITIPDGVTVTDRLDFKPPPDSLCQFWYNTSLTGSTVLFVVSAPTGSVFDVHVTYTDSASLAGYNSTIASGVVGSRYYLALDGPASNLIRPLGVPTTA